MEIFLNEEFSKCFIRISKLEHIDELKEDLKLFLFQFMDKDSRRSYLFDLLPIKKQQILSNQSSDQLFDEKEFENNIKKRSKIAYKIISF